MRKFFLIILTGVFFALCAHAAQTGCFDLLPVAESGRIVPLQSYASKTHRQIFGEDITGAAATKFLAQALFDPAQAALENQFIVKDKAVKAALGLPLSKSEFTLQDLSGAFASHAPLMRQLGALKDGEAPTADQATVLDLYSRFSAYQFLLRSFSGLLPLDVNLPKKYAARFAQSSPSFADLESLRPVLQKDLKALIARKGMDIKSYTEDEQALALASYDLNHIALGGADNGFFKIIPARGNQWVSPWEFSRAAAPAPGSQKVLEAWRRLALSYSQGDQKTWEKNACDVLGTARSINLAEVSLWRFRVENFTSLYEMRMAAIAFYGLAIIALFMPFISMRICMAVAAMPVILHLFYLASRIVILGRPPVAALHETLMFVSFICAVLGWAFFKRTHHKIALAGLYGMAGGLLCLIPFLLPSGGDKETLLPVLNTNFWLATHVLCITAGYASCIAAACLAHLRLFFGERQAPFAVSLQALHAFSLIALFLTLTGTALGGIWADQSWGRFWGWDPKENGALLIVLWLLWLLHGRMAGRLSAPFFTALMAALNIVVALSWFGVNLLGTGLHSYGFTSGVAGALAAFCGCEAVLIFLLTFRAIRRKILE